MAFRGFVMGDLKHVESRWNNPMCSLPAVQSAARHVPLHELHAHPSLVAWKKTPDVVSHPRMYQCVALEDEAFFKKCFDDTYAFD